MHTTIRPRVSMTLAVSTLVFCASPFLQTALSPQAQLKTSLPASQEQRTKIAQGEYVILQRANAGAIGPIGEQIYDFHETWTLSRMASGRYEIQGEQRFESPQGVSRANRFAAELSRDLTVTRVTEFSRLKWRRDSGPLTCEFLSAALRCSSNAKDPRQLIDLKIRMRAPFGLLWPISAFSLGGLTRNAERDPRQSMHIQLIVIEQPSAEMPVNPIILDGNLRYLGEETIDVAGMPRPALKFSVKVALSPELLVWTSRRGLLLRVAVRHERNDWPEESMKLIHFQEWPGFE